MLLRFAIIVSMETYTACKTKRGRPAGDFMEGVEMLMTHLQGCPCCRHNDEELAGAVARSTSCVHIYLRWLKKNGKIFIIQARNNYCTQSRRAIFKTEEEMMTYLQSPPPGPPPYRKERPRTGRRPGRPSGLGWRNMIHLLKHIQNDKACCHNNKKLSHYMHKEAGSIGYYLSIAKRIGYITTQVFRTRLENNIWLTRRVIKITDKGHGVLEL